MSGQLLGGAGGRGNPGGCRGRRWGGRSPETAIQIFFSVENKINNQSVSHLKGDDVDGTVSRGLEIHQLQGSSQGQGRGAGGVHLTNITIVSRKNIYIN